MLDIETYQGVPIHLSTLDGHFYATMAPTILREERLPALRARIDTLTRQSRLYGHNTAVPLPPVNILYARDAHEWKLYEGVLLYGLHGDGHKRLRATSTSGEFLALQFGHPNQSHVYDESIVVLAEDDPRNLAVREALDTFDQAKNAAASAQAALLYLVASLPTVTVPIVKGEAQAMDLEPDFLDAVRKAITHP